MRIVRSRSSKDSLGYSEYEYVPLSQAATELHRSFWMLSVRFDDGLEIGNTMAVSSIHGSIEYCPQERYSGTPFCSEGYHQIPDSTG